MGPRLALVLLLALRFCPSQPFPRSPVPAKRKGSAPESRPSDGPWSWARIKRPEKDSAPAAPVAAKGPHLGRNFAEQFGNFTENLPFPRDFRIPNNTGIGIFFSGLGSGIILTTTLLLAPSVNMESSMRTSLLLFQDVLAEVERAYVEELDPQKLTETALQAMLSSLDPYTTLQKSDDLREQVQGRYGGVGLVISEPLQISDVQKAKALPTLKTPNQPKTPKGPGIKGSGAAGTTRSEESSVVVLSAFEGYAWDAGMRVGDRILAIDDAPMTGLSLDSVRDKLRGPPDTKVKLKIARDVMGSGPAGKEFEITLDRKAIQLDDVRIGTLWGRREEGLAYVQLSGFGGSVASDLAKSLINLEAQAPEGLKGVILDLRGNPGGLLSSAVEVSSLLVPKGSTIVTADGRAFNTVRYKSTAEPLRPLDLPLVVLVNSGTASAAEIVAGAVQDLDAGVVVGMGDGRTFGKGLVQEVEELEDGNAIKYTIAKYYTPSGRCIQSDTYKSAVAKATKKDAGDSTSSSTPIVSDVKGERRPAKGFTSTKIKDQDKRIFKTRIGRDVRDGGGIEADVKVANPPLSPLTQALVSQGAFFDFASEWTRKHEFVSFVDAGSNEVLKSFEEFVKRRESQGLLRLDAVVPQLADIEQGLSDAGLPQTVSEVQRLRSTLRKELTNDFRKEEDEIRLVLQDALSSRFLPDKMLSVYKLEKDKQFLKGLEILRSKRAYEAILQAPKAS
mmetsp:Transcript_6224/g.24268  ORF Transcript_6224/g.24268 Transcript_6224/m.24268 type:complete len:729 (-) Transcript_6224:931-3117(-)